MYVRRRTREQWLTTTCTCGLGYSLVFCLTATRDCRVLAGRYCDTVIRNSINGSESPCRTLPATVFASRMPLEGPPGRYRINVVYYIAFHGVSTENGAADRSVRQSLNAVDRTRPFEHSHSDYINYPGRRASVGCKLVSECTKSIAACEMPQTWNHNSKHFTCLAYSSIIYRQQGTRASRPSRNCHIIEPRR